MNRKFSTLLKKTLFLAGALTLGWAARAQSATDNTSDTTHPHMMHHRWGNRPGGMVVDSLAKKDGAPRGSGGWRRGPGGFRDGRDDYAFHRPGQDRFGNGRFDRNGRFGGHERLGRHERGGWGHGREFVRFTPEQRRQIMTIDKDYRRKTAALFKQDDITLKQYKTGLIALQKEKKNKIQALLTPQQQEEISARRKRMNENALVIAAARLERLKLRLSLSDDQVAKIKAGQDNLRSQFLAIHDNDNLLPQQKKEQLRTLMTTRNDTFKSVLTPDQYTKFRQMSRHRPGGPWQGHGFGGKTTG